MSATIMTFYNEKGGVGKTSTIAMVGYNLAKMGYRVLLIDYDPQANLTEVMIKTAGNHSSIVTIQKSLMTAINDGTPINDIRINIMPNLFLIPTASDFYLYPRYIERMFPNEVDRVMSFSTLITDRMRELYDFIFVDVPPTFTITNDAVFYACDQMIIMLQTQIRSFGGAKRVVSYLQKNLIDEFHAKIDILGVLPVMSKKKSKIDEETLQDARDYFQENMFNNVIYLMNRVKNMDKTGITDKDRWDEIAHKAFIGVIHEMLDRLDREGDHKEVITNG